MAYNLMVEFPKPPDWSQLALVASDCRFVEMFPMAEEDDDPAAVGISVPMKGATNDGWLELRRVLDLLQGRLAGRVIDLYSGNQVVPGEYETIRTAMLA